MNLKASQQAILDLHALAIQNDNPKISHYRQGYERYFNGIPAIKSREDVNWSSRRIANDIMKKVALRLSGERWVRENTPVNNPLLRTVIGMEQPECTPLGLKSGAELIVVNWQAGVKTPTHGHEAGYMHERLIFGTVRQATYRIVDKEKMIARPISLELFCNNNDEIDAGYNGDNGLTNGAFVHDFTFLEPTATLNLVPSHPKDTKGNVFTVEEFGFKDIDVTKQFSAVMEAKDSIKLQPGEVILVRSNTTKDLGDHFYIITDQPTLKKAGMRPTGRAIAASADFSLLLERTNCQEGVTMLRLTPEARDLFLEWHGIEVSRKLIFPEP